MTCDLRKRLFTACWVISAATFLAAAAPAIAGGPPGVSVRVPEQALEGAARGACLLVHTTRCGGPWAEKVEARAVGTVDGRKYSYRLKLVPTGRTGELAVHRQWPARGEWALLFVVDHAGAASALVRLGPNGGIPAAASAGGAGEELRIESTRTAAKKLEERDAWSALSRQSSL